MPAVSGFCLCYRFASIHGDNYGMHEDRYKRLSVHVHMHIYFVYQAHDTLQPVTVAVMLYIMC